MGCVLFGKSFSVQVAFLEEPRARNLCGQRGPHTRRPSNVRAGALLTQSANAGACRAPLGAARARRGAADGDGNAGAVGFCHADALHALLPRLSAGRRRFQLWRRTGL